MTARIIEAVIIGVAVAVLAALFQSLIDELLVPALREWRERRKAAESVPARRRPRDWPVWLALLIPLVTWTLMLLVYGAVRLSGLATPGAPP